MNRRLADTSFLSLLPEVIRQDPQLSVAANSLDYLLKKVTYSIPNLLLWARLNQNSAVCIPPLQSIVEASGGLRSLSTEQLELLAWQFHVDFREIATDNSMLELMVRESIPWHRIKGTPASVEQALLMYDVESVVDESGTGQNWAVYELYLKKIPTTDSLKKIVNLAKETSPARCKLRRVYGGYDRRPIILDKGPNVDWGFLDDDSGVWNNVTGVKESFGEVHKFFAEVKSCEIISSSLTQNHFSSIFYIDKMILDQWVLDSSIIQTHGVIGGSLVSHINGGIWQEKLYWEGEWDSRRWSNLGVPTPSRKIDQCSIVSKAQIVVDYNLLDSGLEVLDRHQVTTSEKSYLLDITHLDCNKQDLQIKTYFVDERVCKKCTFYVDKNPSNAFVKVFNISTLLAKREQIPIKIESISFKECITKIISLRNTMSLPDGEELIELCSDRICPGFDAYITIKNYKKGD